MPEYPSLYRRGFCICDYSGWANVIEYLGYSKLNISRDRYILFWQLDFTPFTLWNEISRIRNTGTQASVPSFTYPAYRLE